MDRNTHNQIPLLPRLSSAISDLFWNGKPKKHCEDLDFSGCMEQELLTHNVLDEQVGFSPVGPQLIQDKQAYSYEDEFGEYGSSDEGNSEYLSKRKDHNGEYLERKRRLKGMELVESLKLNPMFKDHTELFQDGLDDYQRRKMMQKIRNRVSAQESRDRKKMQYHGLEELNDKLRKENTSLKVELDFVKAENVKLKTQIDNLTKKSIKNSPSESTHNGTDTNEFDGQSNFESDKDEFHTSSPVLTRRNSGSSDIFGKAVWSLNSMVVLVLVCILCMTAPRLDHGSDSGIVKSSAIVPLAGARSMSLYSSNHYKNMMKLNGVCDAYCELKQKALVESQTWKARRVSDQILALPNEEILRKNGTIDVFIHHDELDSDQAPSGGLVPQNKPFSTMMCGKVEWLDNQPASKLIHMIVKKDNNESVPMQDMLDALPAGSQIEEEYVSLVAEIKSRKAIRIIKNTPMDSGFAEEI